MVLPSRGCIAHFRGTLFAPQALHMGSIGFLLQFERAALCAVSYMTYTGTHWPIDVVIRKYAGWASMLMHSRIDNARSFGEDCWEGCCTWVSLRVTGFNRCIARTERSLLHWFQLQLQMTAVQAQMQCDPKQAEASQAQAA